MSTSASFRAILLATPRIKQGLWTIIYDNFDDAHSRSRLCHHILKLKYFDNRKVFHPIFFTRAKIHKFLPHTVVLVTFTASTYKKVKGAGFKFLATTLIAFHNVLAQSPLHRS
jgi:hypothetical protein